MIKLDIMQPSLEKLRKFFRLEHENKYQNTAVIGGLASMLDYWEGEARADGIAEEVIQAVVARLRSYEKLSLDGRAESLKGLWKRIGEMYPEAAQKPKEQQPAPRQERGASSPQGEQVKEVQVKKEESHNQAPQKNYQEQKQRSNPAPRSEAVAGAKHSQTPAALNSKLTVLQGVGPKNAEALEKLGMQTLGDMLHYYPRRYEDYSQLKPIQALMYNDVVTVLGSVHSVYNRPIRGGKSSVLEVVISDGTGSLRISFFNQPWLLNRLNKDDTISVSGKIDQYLGKLVMNSPDWEPVEVESLHTNRIVPIYSLTERITQKWLRGQMNQVIPFWAPAVVDVLPESIRLSARLVSIGEALTQVHFPNSQDRLKLARERLAFDEIFYLQMGVLRQKRDWKSVEGRRFTISDEWLGARLGALPFTLTSAQQTTLEDIRKDLDSGKPMNRLVQGDVGSGKTVVAALGACMVVEGGAQAAIMAPTAILAEQHHRNFVALLGNMESDGLPSEVQERAPALQKIRLLVGDTPEKEKEEIRQGLQDGSIKIIIGTHAVIEPNINFKDLQFVVIDEQHRFGVEQRKELRSKGTNPHLLVMTATPIPRSLALTVFGDLDISVIDEMPAGRQPINTFVLRPQERERAFTLIRAQIKDGKQVFIVYPLIDESEKLDARAAVDDFETLTKEVFPDLKLGLLHGRMKPSEKDNVMAKFRNKEFDILVSTTVIEVGVDIPNSTVMLIEGADRFGLAQLHQLRGRVGRSTDQSYCLLIPTREDATENDRLQAMATTNSGFDLADLDLKIRGPGEFLGTRQAGFASSLKMANITDVKLIEKAREQAIALFAKDPELNQPEHALLAEAVERFWNGTKSDVS